LLVLVQVPGNILGEACYTDFLLHGYLYCLRAYAHQQFVTATCWSNRQLVSFCFTCCFQHVADVDGNLSICCLGILLMCMSF